MAMPCRLHGDILLLLLGAVAVAVAHPAANEVGCARISLSLDRQRVWLVWLV